MDWLQKFNAVLEYIENNLEDEVEYAEIARVACCSEFHFSRMFTSLAGVSLSEYIRRRRLTKAACDIQNGDGKIIEIALKYGYDSPDAFTRAFKKLHGVSPTAIRKSSVQLKAFPRMAVQIEIKGDVDVDYRIEKLDFALRFAGMYHPVKTSASFQEVPGIWRTAGESGLQQKLIEMAWENPKCKLASLVGICGKEAQIMADYMEYFTGVRYDNAIPAGMAELIIPACDYAVFSSTLQHAAKTWQSLYAEWLPATGYKLADSPCIEHFPGPGQSTEYELWAPLAG